MLLNASPSLTVLMAANARMSAFGYDSATLQAAPKNVAPRVTTSSTNKMLVGSVTVGVTTIVSQCLMGSGLFSGLLVAYFCICVTREMQVATLDPNPTFTKDFASIFEVHIVLGLVSELPGMGISTTPLEKKSGNRRPSAHHFATLS